MYNTGAYLHLDFISHILIQLRPVQNQLPPEVPQAYIVRATIRALQTIQQYPHGIKH